MPQPLLTIYLGDCTIQLRTTLSVDPDDVFTACNRIGTIDDDINHLRHDWQRELRRIIDHDELRSMCVGDIFTLDIGSISRVWVVADTGFMYGEAVPGKRFEHCL